MLSHIKAHEAFMVPPRQVGRTITVHKLSASPWICALQKDTAGTLDFSEGKSKDTLAGAGGGRGLWARITTVLGGGFVNVNAGRN
jgi:hypothetical protein